MPSPEVYEGSGAPIPSLAVIPRYWAAGAGHVLTMGLRPNGTCRDFYQRRSVDPFQPYCKHQGPALWSSPAWEAIEIAHSQCSGKAHTNVVIRLMTNT